MDVKTFRDLFVHRDDVYSVQRPNGAYSPERVVLEDVDIEAHLGGTRTIGLYQLKPVENTIKWAVLDIDILKDKYTAEGFDLKDWLPSLVEQAELAKRR